MKEILEAAVTIRHNYSVTDEESEHDQRQSEVEGNDGASTRVHLTEVTGAYEPGDIIIQVQPPVAVPYILEGLIMATVSTDVMSSFNEFASMRFISNNPLRDSGIALLKDHFYAIRNTNEEVLKCTLEMFVILISL